MRGIAALLTLFIAAMVMVALAALLVMLSLERLDTVSASREGLRAFAAAEACLDEGFLRLVRDENFSGTTLNFAGGVVQCTVSVSGSGDSRTLDAVGTAGEIQQSVRALFNRSTRTLTSWVEPAP